MYFTSGLHFNMGYNACLIFENASNPITNILFKQLLEREFVK